MTRGGEVRCAGAMDVLMVACVAKTSAISSENYLFHYFRLCVLGRVFIKGLRS